MKMAKKQTKKKDETGDKQPFMALSLLAVMNGSQLCCVCVFVGGWRSEVVGVKLPRSSLRTGIN